MWAEAQGWRVEAVLAPQSISARVDEPWVASEPTMAAQAWLFSDKRHRSLFASRQTDI